MQTFDLKPVRQRGNVSQFLKFQYLLYENSH